MQDLEIYLSLGITIFGLFISTLAFLSKSVKNLKARRKAEELLSIGQELIPFIEEAEKFMHYSGAEKKEYVMTKMLQKLISKKSRVKPEDISAKIEELVALTKEVNVRGRAKELKKLSD